MILRSVSSRDIPLSLYCYILNYSFCPIIGDLILLIVRGGKELSAITLARFFGVHVWVLPATLLFLVSIHMYLVIKIGISASPGR